MMPVFTHTYDNREQGGAVMFGDAHIAWLVRRERNRDLLREAERYRLVRHVLPARCQQGPFYCQALIWLGRRLVDWGRHLQEHHDVVVDTSVLRTANQSQ
jgi:hypothetical protein